MQKKASNIFLVAATTVALIVVSNVATAARDIRVGHLTYHTGEFGDFGAIFDGITNFTVDIINQDPPLGRKFNVVHKDIGTVGEPSAVRYLLNIERVDVLFNVARHYESYRKQLLKRINLFQRPLLPSVHGGVIDAAYGGVAEEPLFRGSPMDTSQSAAALLHLKKAGKKRIALVATTFTGHKMQAEAVKKYAKKLGLEVVGSVEIEAAWTDYTAVATQIDALGADAVVILTAPTSGSILIRNAAEAGHSWYIIGGSEWQGPAFAEEVTSAVISKHQAILLSAYTHANNDAWTFYKSAAASSSHANVIGDVSNSYALQYYDLLVVSALAIEKAGSIDAKEWSKAMYSVTGGDGEIVYTYEDGIKALRAGKEINYDGVTGSMEYTDNGVVAGLLGIFQWNSNMELLKIGVVDGDIVAELDQD